MSQPKYTIKDFNLKYPDEESCLEQLFNQRYGHFEFCPKCGKGFKYYKVKGRKCYECGECGNQISPTAGTIYHKSDTDLRLWFYAIFLFCSSKNGVSAKELERQLGVTYKTAWRMAKQIRSLFDETGDDKLKGIVEADETYVGGSKTNTKKHKLVQKTAVLGAVERKGRIFARVADNVTHSNVSPFIRGKIDIDSVLVTDENPVYDQLLEITN